MPVIYNTAVKTDRMEATMAYFANGSLELLSAGDAVLATFGLDSNGGTVSGAVWTLVFDSDTVSGESAASTGTAAAKARIKTSGGDAHLTGLTVGTVGSGEDIELINTSISSGQDVTISSATITHAPDPS